MLTRPENPAAENGPSVFDWWKDWRGRAVAIVASGPSLKRGDVDLLKGRIPVVAIKRNVELAPWADVVYGCDAPWWRSVRGLPSFGGLKLAYDKSACGEYGLHQISIPNAKGDDILFNEPGVIGSGGNSGFQALNIVAQFGADRILLIGFDVSGRSGAHWYGRNNWMGANNPTEDNFNRWRRAFIFASRRLEQLGVEVVNCSAFSEMTCFPRGTVAATLERWGL